MNHGNDIISNILDLANWSRIHITCLFSNSLFYCRHYLPLAVMLRLSHTLSLCLSAVLLSSLFFPFDIKSPGKPFQIIIVFFKLFQFSSLSFHLDVCTQQSMWLTSRKGFVRLGHFCKTDNKSNKCLTPIRKRFRIGHSTFCLTRWRHDYLAERQSAE